MKTQLLALSLFLSSLPTMATTSSDTTTTGFSASTTSTSSTSSTTGLTDEQKKISDNYIHQGLTKRTYDTACTGKEDMCNGNSAYVFSSMGDVTIEQVSKLYATFSALGGNKYKIGDKDKTDFCAYIPGVSEGSALVYQQAQNSSIQNSATTTTSSTTAESTQRTALLKAARAHLARSTAAEIQTAGWAATAVCYASLAAYNASKGNNIKSLWIKGSAATALGIFYGMKIQKHKGWAAETKKIADSLPGAGDCNPVTQKDCYCAQPETANDTAYCVTTNTKVASGSIVISCTDSNLNNDSTCACKTTNTCFDISYKTLSAGVNFGANVTSSLGSTLTALSTGTGTSASLNALSTEQLAMARKIINANGSALVEETKNTNLTPTQRQHANNLVALGLSTEAANALAANMSGSSKSGNVAPITASNGVTNTKALPKAKAQAPTSGTVLYFPTNTKSSKSDDDEMKIDLSAFQKNKDKKGNDGDKILNFNEKAQEKAEIHQNTSRPLFEIISHRYQASGVKYLNGTSSVVELNGK